MNKGIIHALVHDISNASLHIFAFLFLWNISHTSAMVLGGLYLIKQVSYFLHLRVLKQRDMEEAAKLLKEYQDSLLSQNAYQHVEQEEQDWSEETVKVKDDSSKIH